MVDSIRSGWITTGPKTHRFEDEFSRYIGSRHSVAVNSCTAALHLALKVIGIDRDDEVILPAMTFTATAEVATYMGARPVLVDIERDTYNIDIHEIEKSITWKTRAIIPVHYAGQVCDVAGIMKIAKKHNLYVIEDAAHSLPAWYNSNVRREMAKSRHNRRYYMFQFLCHKDPCNRRRRDGLHSKRRVGGEDQNPQA